MRGQIKPRVTYTKYLSEEKKAYLADNEEEGTLCVEWSFSMK